LAHPAPMIGFCCLNFGEFTKTTTGYAYENNGIRSSPLRKKKVCVCPESANSIKPRVTGAHWFS
jgi:hypothetical protein